MARFCTTRKYLKLKALLALSLLLILSGRVCAAPIEVVDPQLYLSVTSFNWREYDDRGTRILKESGPLYGIGSSAGIDFYQRRLMMRLKLEAFGSDVEYRGQTQNDPSFPKQSGRPVSTDVTYLGGEADADLGWRQPLGGFAIEPFAGAGFRGWMRDLKSSTAVGTDNVLFPVSGYTEWWKVAWFRTGVRADYSCDRDLRLYLLGGALYPFYVGNSVSLTDFGSVTFHPQGEWSGLGELGIRYQHLSGAIFYQGFRVSASPTVPVATKLYLQPDSSSDLLGVRLGWAF